MEGNRILIIAMGRSGGYTLGEWLSREFDCRFVHEPKINNLDERGYNVVTKYLITEWEVQKYPPIGEYNKIIRLIRESDRECAESQCWAETNNEWRREYTIPKEWIKENQSYITEMEGWVQRKREAVKGIEGGILVSYEGIYQRGEDIQKIIDYVGIEKAVYTHLLDIGNKLRDRNKIKRKLI